MILQEIYMYFLVQDRNVMLTHVTLIMVDVHILVIQHQMEQYVFSLFMVIKLFLYDSNHERKWMIVMYWNCWITYFIFLNVHFTDYVWLNLKFWYKLILCKTVKFYLYVMSLYFLYFYLISFYFWTECFFIWQNNIINTIF